MPPLSYFCDSPKKINGKSCQFFLTFPKYVNGRLGTTFCSQITFSVVGSSCPTQLTNTNKKYTNTALDTVDSIDILVKQGRVLPVSGFFDFSEIYEWKVGDYFLQSDNV